MSNVIFTGKVSLGIQFAVGMLDVYALTLPRSRDVLLRDLLKLELGIQTIEFVFYVWMVQSWGTHSLAGIVRYRYYDWMISTPTMLITLMAFLGADEDKPLSTFVNEHYSFIAQIVGLNLSMLLLGLAGEYDRLPQNYSVALGFIPFITYFGMIYQRFVHNKNLSTRKVQLFFYFFVIWSVYGIVALLPDEPKNIGYNILDLFSKNLLGVVLSVLIFLRPVS